MTEETLTQVLISHFQNLGNNDRTVDFRRQNCWQSPNESFDFCSVYALTFVLRQGY